MALHPTLHGPTNSELTLSAFADTRAKGMSLYAFTVSAVGFINARVPISLHPRCYELTLGRRRLSELPSSHLVAKTPFRSQLRRPDRPEEHGQSLHLYLRLLGCC